MKWEMDVPMPIHPDTSKDIQNLIAKPKQD
jgi:hypothetical protein